MKFVLLILLSLAVFGDTLRFGVMVHTTKDIAKSQYQPLVDYLNTKLDKNVTLELLTQQELEERIKNKTIDIVTTNGGHYIVLRKKYQLGGILASLIRNSGENEPVYKLGGVIFTRSDSDISSLKDIEHKSISSSGIEHIGAYWAQAYELKKHNIDINPKSNHMLFTHGSQSDVVKNIIAKKADVGFVRDGVIEDLVKKGELNLKDIKIINQKKYSDHPYISSTALYPEWPLFIMPYVSQDDIKSIVIALLSISDEQRAIRDNGIYGYNIPSDYHEIEELALSLRLPPYDEIVTISYAEIYDKHKIEILLIAIMIILLIVYYQYNRYKKKIFLTLLNSIGDGVYSVDNSEKCTWINKQGLRLLGYKRDEVLGQDTHKLFHLDDNESSCPITQTIRDKTIRKKERVFVRKNGNHIDVNMTVAPTPKGAIVIFRDITEEKKLKEALKNSEFGLKKAQEIANIGSWELDLRTSKLSWSDQIYTIFGLNKDAIDPTYEAFLERIYPDDRALVNNAYIKSLETRELYTIEHRLQTPDGNIKWVREIGDSEYDSNGIATFSRGTVQDITEQVLATQELKSVKNALEELNGELQSKNILLKEQALKDGLTGISNRRSFDELYDKMYKEALRERFSVAVFMIDVDLFKLYNDFYGHIAGDECLKSIAKMLASTLKRPTDIVARYGGEEFVVVVKDVDEYGALKVADKLNKAIVSLAIEHQKSSVSDVVTISIGVSIKYIDQDITKEQLIQNADEALYRAKSNGRNQVCIYNSEKCQKG